MPPAATGNATAALNSSDSSLRSIGAEYRVQSTLSVGGRTLSTYRTSRVTRTRDADDRWATRVTFDAASAGSAGTQGVREIFYTEGVPGAQVSTADGQTLQLPSNETWNAVPSPAMKPYPFTSVQEVPLANPSSQLAAVAPRPARLPGGFLSTAEAQRRIGAIESTYGRPLRTSTQDLLRYERRERDTLVTLAVATAVGEVVGARVVVAGVEVLRVERSITRVRPDLYVVTRAAHAIVDRKRGTLITSTVLIGDIELTFTP